MVLSLTEIAPRFPTLVLDPDGSGFVDAQEAADDTTRPDDTPEDILAQGRLDGYKVAYSDPGGLFEIQSSLDVFDTTESAETYLQGQINDFHSLVGEVIDEEPGVILDEFLEAPPPNLGTAAGAGRLTASFTQFGLVAYFTFVTWVRDELLASVAVVAFEDVDRGAAVERLAKQMNFRINGVLSGQIEITPLDTEAEEFDLPSMLPTLDDLPAGFAVESEGFISEPDSYERTFNARALVADFRSSVVSNITNTIDLHRNALDSRGLVLTLQDFGADEFGEIAGEVIAEDAELTLQSLDVEKLNVPPIGDGAVGFLLKMGTPIGNVDAIIIVFVQGRVTGQVLVLGPPGQVILDDVASLAELIVGRVQAGTP